MWPTFFLFGVSFPAESVLTACGLFAGLATLLLAVRRKRLSVDFLADNSWLFLIVLFVGARVGEMLWYQYPFLSFPFFWRDTGFSFQVGVLGFLLALAVLARRQQQAYMPWLDICVLTTTAGLIFFHMGAFLSGHMYGTPTALPWGVVYTHPDAATLTTLPVHPTQIYALVVTLVLFVSAAFIFKKTRVAGKTAAFLLFLLPLAYFLIDFLRDDSAPSFFDLRASQYVWFVYMAIGISISTRLRMRTTDHRSELSLSRTSYD